MQLVEERVSEKEEAESDQESEIEEIDEELVQMFRFQRYWFLILISKVNIEKSYLLKLVSIKIKYDKKLE